MHIRSINFMNPGLRLPIFFAPDDGTGDGKVDDDGKGKGKTDDSASDDKTKTGKDADDGTGSGNDSGGKTYTQDEVDALDKKLQKRYGNAGQKALLEELGLESADDLKSLVDAQKARDEKDMSDAEKATAAAETARQEADTEKAAALAEKMEFRLKSALMTPGEDAEKEPGLNPDRVEGAMAVALRHIGNSDETEAEQLIADAVAHTRTQLPEVFGTQAASGKPKSPGTSGRPGGQRTTNKSGDKPDGAEAMKAYQEKQKSKFKPLGSTPD